MARLPSPPDRRRRALLGLSALGLGSGALGLSAAAPLRATPSQSLGPFYPERIPVEHDSDLTRVAGGSGTARGVSSLVQGVVKAQDGRPVADALVEIWQCDAFGRYHHPGDRRATARDPNFQGYGRTRSASDGRYAFLTIKPVPYPGRAPHIHFAVRAPGHPPLVTQMYVRGAPENDGDFLLGRAGDAARLLVVPFGPSPDPRAELMARFDLVLA